MTSAPSKSFLRFSEYVGGILGHQLYEVYDNECIEKGKDADEVRVGCGSLLSVRLSHIGGSARVEHIYVGCGIRSITHIEHY